MRGWRSAAACSLRAARHGPNAHLFGGGPPTSAVAGPLATPSQALGAPHANGGAKGPRHRTTPPPPSPPLPPPAPPRADPPPDFPQIFVSNATGNVRITSIVRVCRVAFAPEENPDPDQMKEDEPPVFYCRSQYFQKQVRRKGGAGRGDGGGTSTACGGCAGVAIVRLYDCAAAGRPTVRRLTLPPSPPLLRHLAPSPPCRTRSRW